MPIRDHLSGGLARIVRYERAVNGRCPASDFLRELEGRERKKFAGQFDALTKIGSSYENHQRFTPLRGAGKPLWEFKESDHRLYCHRRSVGKYVEVVLFNGWVKDKAGKTDREDREIAKAQSLLEEFLSEFPGGNI